MSISYISPEDAEKILGVSVTQEQLMVAHSIVCSFSRLRWEATTISETYSWTELKGDCYLFIRFPVNSITSLVVDGDTLTVDTDYIIYKKTGKLQFYTGVPRDTLDNIVITYIYGYSSTHEMYNMVVCAEAQIALYLKKNPLMLGRIGAGEVGMSYDDHHIQKILVSMVPMEIRL